MGDEERTPDDPELEQAEDAGQDADDDADDDADVAAHSRPLPPPRPMNGL